MSNMGHYQAHSDEPLSPEEMALARRLMSDPMALINSPVFNWIKDYISVQPCCGGDGTPRTGHANAILLQARADSWYGMGDGGSVNSDPITNYGDGPNAAVHAGAGTETHVGSAGAFGTGVPDWGLAQDTASWVGETKTQQAPGGYNIEPGVRCTDSINTANGLSVNAWILFSDFGVNYDNQGGLDNRGYSPIWGWRGAGNVGVWMDIVGDLQIHGNPFSSDMRQLRCVIGDGTTVSSLLGGIGASDGGWHMVSFTIDPDTQLMSLYIDGGLVNSGSYAGTLDQASVAQVIGMLDYGGFLGSNGGNWGNNSYIDEVGIWSGPVLTGGDFEDLYGG